MRKFYSDEGPIDTLLQIDAAPVLDGDLVSKVCRDEFVVIGWVARCEGYNIITMAGRKAISALKLVRVKVVEWPDGSLLKEVFAADAVGVSLAIRDGLAPEASRPADP